MSEDVLREFRGLTDVHLPHGQRYISEFTHLMLGAAIGRVLLRLTGTPADQPLAGVSESEVRMERPENAPGSGTRQVGSTGSPASGMPERGR